MGGKKESGITTNDRISQLDALRGVACLMVLFAHLKSVPQFASVPEFVGAAGVGVFFVLSGFLITRGLLRSVDLFRFYNRRAARILPIYYFVVLVVGLIWSGKEIFWAADFTLNLRLLTDVQDYYKTAGDALSPPPLAHFWSLCVEEHFYWVWPWVVAILPRRWLWTVPTLIILGTSPTTVWLGDRLLSQGFGRWQVDGLLSRMTPTQLVAISLGALSAINENWLMGKVVIRSFQAPRRLLVAVALLLLSFVVQPLLALFFLPRGALASATTTELHLNCGAAFLIVWGLPIIAQLKWLSWVGQISYGLYLYHLPIYAACGLLRPNEKSDMLMALTALTINFFIAAVSYRFLEKPLINSARNGYPQVAHENWSRWIGPILTFMTFGLFATDLVRSDQIKDHLDTKINPSPKATKPSAQQVNPGEIRTIVVGGSHADHGFACPEFYEPAYNFGFHCNDIWYDKGVIQKSIRELPNLKKVIFFLSIMSYRQSMSYRAPWVEDLQYLAYGIRARNDQGDRKYRSTITKQEVEVFKELNSKAFRLDEPYRGWHPMPHRAQELTLRKAKYCANAHTVTETLFEHENIELFVETLVECKDRDIECFIVMAPTHHLYRSALHPEYVGRMTEIAKSIAQKTNVRLLDYRDDSRFVDKDFGDVIHLSKEGAIKFTKILEIEMQSLP